MPERHLLELPPVLHELLGLHRLLALVVRRPESHHVELERRQSSVQEIRRARLIDLGRTRAPPSSCSTLEAISTWFCLGSFPASDTASAGIARFPAESALNATLPTIHVLGEHQHVRSHVLDDLQPPRPEFRSAVPCGADSTSQSSSFLRCSLRQCLSHRHFACPHPMHRHTRNRRARRRNRIRIRLKLQLVLEKRLHRVFDRI